MAETSVGPGRADGAGPKVRASAFVSVLAAMVSLALMAGAAYWGVRLAMRDVNGVPVVRALKGPMREAPADPGGAFAANQGLSVNRIAADGSASPPVDRLILAPRPAELDSADRAIASDAAVEGSVPEAPAAVAPAPAEPQQSAIDDAVSAALRDGGAVDEGGPDPAPEEVAELPDGALATSPRPMLRPETGDRSMQTAVETPALGDVPESDGSALPSGTLLVQLGAFPSAEAARAEWTRIAERFGGLLEGKARIVQPARAANRDFFRLRAQGFADEPDQRRFCAALTAEDAPCVAVAVR